MNGPAGFDGNRFGFQDFGSAGNLEGHFELDLYAEQEALRYDNQARQGLLPRRRGSAGQASGNPWLAGRMALSPLDRLRAGGFGRFCPAITRCSLATTSTFKAAEYAALSPGSVVNSFLRRLGIWVHDSRYGVSRSRTTDCPSERHVSAKGSHRRQQSTSAARSLSSGALIQ